MLRWVIDKQMDVFGFAVHLNQLGFKIKADLLKHHFQALDGVSIKYLSSILGDEDQVNVEQENAMPAVSDFA